MELVLLSVFVTRKKKQRCGMSVQKIKEETFLHTCAFPLMDILLYVETHLDVVDGNSSLYRRTVSVEDHCETFLSHGKYFGRIYGVFSKFSNPFFTP